MSATRSIRRWGSPQPKPPGSERSSRLRRTRLPPGAGSRRAALAAESPVPSLGLKLAGVGRLLDAGIRLAAPPPREPLGEEQAERRDEREDLRHDVSWRWGWGRTGSRIRLAPIPRTRAVSGPGGRRRALTVHYGRHQPYESGSETPNAIKIAMRAKQAPVSRSVLILGMKSMK